MHGLLAIALTMYPMRIDESIHTQLREKYGDKMLRMQKGWGLCARACFQIQNICSCIATKRIALTSEHPFLTWVSRLRNFRDLQVFEELFSFACPKFLSPVVPNYDNVHPNYHKEPFQQQLKVFAEEVQQQAQLSTIRRCVFISSGYLDEDLLLTAGL